MKYDRSADEGILYEGSKELSLKEVTAHIRNTVRSFKKDGLIPAEFAYSVRLHRYAGGGDIEIVVSVPAELLELRRNFEDYLWNNGFQPDFLREPALMTGLYEPLNQLRSTVVLLSELHAGYNYLSVPSNPYEDGCGFRYGGRVAIWEL